MNDSSVAFFLQVAIVTGAGNGLGKAGAHDFHDFLS